jgi:hypothetical protein
MNFKKYSQSEFDSLALDAAATRRLADELEDEVMQEIHEAVSTVFLSVIDALNREGHALKLDGEILSGEIAYRDEPMEGECKLRLACDVIVSAGYSDTKTVEEIDAERLQDP